MGKSYKNRPYINGVICSIHAEFEAKFPAAILAS